MPLTDEERKARRREYSRKWREANSEKKREYQKAYYKENREKMLERNKMWRKDNPDKLREQRKKYHEANREKHYEYKKKWREVNREKWLEQCKRYRDANPDKRRKLNKQYRKANREKFREWQNKHYAGKRGKELTKRRDFGYLTNKENNNAQLRRYTVHLINSSFTFLATSALEACEIAAQHYGWTRIAEPETNGNDYCRYTCFSAKHDTFYITAKLKGDNQ